MTDTEAVDRSVAVERALAARERLLAGRSGERERIPRDRIDGRTLAEPVVADADVPPADRATMDGFAFAAGDGSPLALAGEVYPEDDPPALDSGEAVRVTTGAPLPAGADAVLERERATVEDGRLTGPAIEPGRHVYRRGTNARAGETLIEAGERLAPRDAALLADVGVETVGAAAPLSVGILATGTEIAEGRQPDRDSEMLANLVASWGGTPALSGAVRDEPAVVRAAVGGAADECDVVLTTGGTGGGAKDFLGGALDALGEVAFAGVRARPGRFVTLAPLRDHGAVAVALPGKPIAAHAAATTVVRALLTGRTDEPTVEREMACRLDLPGAEYEYVVPVTLSGGTATPLGHAESAFPVYGDRFDPRLLASTTRATRADGFLRTEAPLSAGERVGVVPYGVVE